MAKIYWTNLEDELVQAIKNPVIQGAVKKINDKIPDENGLVTITASDLEAITSQELTTALADVIKKNDIVDNLTTGGSQKALSAEQGKILKNMIETLNIAEVIRSVNGKTPNEQGRVDITASDIDTYNITTLDSKFNSANENITKLQTEKVDKNDIIDNLTTDDSTKVLSAKQGKVLNDKIIGTEIFTPEEKTKLANIEDEANKYVLPIGSTTTLGGLKPDGTSIKVTAEGVISTEVVDLSAYIKTVNTTITPDSQGNILLTIGDLDGYTKTETNSAIKATDDKVISHIADTAIHTTQAEKDKLAGIEAEANKYELPIATDTILGGVKQGTGVEITTDGTLNIIPQERVEFGAFTTVTTADATHGFIYTPNVAIKPEDTTKNFIINYNTTTLGEADFSIQEVGGTRVIILNVEEADTIERNSVSGFILRGFLPLS